jgi:hypothetical protein
MQNLPNSISAVQLESCKEDQEANSLGNMHVRGTTLMSV